MDQPQDAQKRRPGPVGFHAEAKVTSLRTPPAANLGGISEASGPKLETPRKSKELKVAGPMVWAAVGVAVFVVGVVLFEGVIAVIGLMTCIAAVFVSRRNKTELRLRSEFHDSDPS